MNQEGKIYTKTGDKGYTSLIGGARVKKFHPRIDAFGTVDELNSFIGLISDHNIDEHYKKILLIIQERLFTLESRLAIDPEIDNVPNLPELKKEDITLLEDEIDSMNNDLPELKSFILPGGHPVISLCHIARTICRRAERLTIRLANSSSVEDIIIMYLNRLSDYLFVLARKLSKDLNVRERHWKSRD